LDFVGIDGCPGDAGKFVASGDVYVELIWFALDYSDVGEDGYAVRNMVAGKDETRQRSIEELRSWLLQRREPVESTR